MRLRAGRVAVAAESGELDPGADAILVVGDRRRSPRTGVPGPFVVTPRGPPGPGRMGSQTRAGRECAASPRPQRGSTTGAARERTVAVLAQRSRRYRDLSGRIVRLLDESGGVVRPLRWTADELGRDELGRGSATG